MPLIEVDGGSGPRDVRSLLERWSATVSDSLNAQLPSGDRQFHAVVMCRTRGQTTDVPSTPDGGPPPAATFPARFADHFGVNFIDKIDGQSVGAAVLFVGADHKADSDGGLVFAVRVAALASAGAGVVVVDVAPGPPQWAAHLNTLIPVYPITRRPRGPGASVLVIHPRVRGGAEQYDVWYHAVAVGGALPTVTVPVRGGPQLTLDLEATYTRALGAGHNS